jgi:hypothetical protein
MLALLTLPIELMRLAFYALQGVVDALRARNRLHLKFTVLVNAPREAVWRLSTADHMILDGPPVVEFSREPLPDSADLWLTRLVLSGHPRAQSVSRELERDEAKAIIIRSRALAHTLSVPPDGGRDVETGLLVEAMSGGTTLTMFGELTAHSFRDRIVYPIGLRRMANLVKQQCEKEAGHLQPPRRPRQPRIGSVDDGPSELLLSVRLGVGAAPFDRHRRTRGRTRCGDADGRRRRVASTSLPSLVVPPSPRQPIGRRADSASSR